MSGYIGNIPVPQATQTRDNFTATAGQTIFATSGYTAGYLDVYLNGVHLDPTDYTATNGTDVVLATGATAGDVVSVVGWTTFDSTTVSFTNLLNTPTTIAGYGITDALELGTSSTTALAGDTALFDGAYASLTSKPTTLSGYGITDAAALAGSASQVFSASTLNATTVDLGNWTVTESSGVLYFATGGTNKMKLDASGNLTITGDVTAYGTV